MIVEFQSENFQRIKVVQIRPHGRLVQLTGGNGQGKTSILDAIAAAIKGKDACPTDPIREGQARAWVSLDLGDKVVRRRFSRGKDGKPYTTDLTVEAKVEGGVAKLASPQTVIDSLMGDISFDPLIFLSWPPAKQVDALRRFVPGVDFQAIARADEADREARAEARRAARQATERAQAIRVPASLPLDPIDEASLLRQMTGAAEFNAAIERRRAVLVKQTETRDALVRRAAEFEAEAAELLVRAASSRAQATGLSAEIEAYEPIPEPLDITGLSQQIASAGQINAQIKERDAQAKLLREAAGHEFEATSRDDAIRDRERRKREAIAAARMPVDGLGLTDDALTFNGHPFEQASQAEKLRVGVALAMASNPLLRVLRIRDGSLLDDRSMAALAEMAEAHDFQVWIERVTNGERVGFVVEDGTVRDAEAAA